MNGRINAPGIGQFRRATTGQSPSLSERVVRARAWRRACHCTTGRRTDWLCASSCRYTSRSAFGRLKRRRVRPPAARARSRLRCRWRWLRSDIRRRDNSRDRMCGPDHVRSSPAQRSARRTGRTDFREANSRSSIEPNLFEPWRIPLFAKFFDGTDYRARYDDCRHRLYIDGELVARKSVAAPRAAGIVKTLKIRSARPPNFCHIFAR